MSIPMQNICIIHGLNLKLAGCRQKLHWHAVNNNAFFVKFGEAQLGKLFENRFQAD